jgi:predicted site-specific integrase-resolvase
MTNEKTSTEKAFISVGNASIITGLDKQTIRKMVDASQIAGYKTPSGQRKINRKGLQTLCNFNIHDENKQIGKKQNFLYTRVSTKKQMDDLSRQVDFIKRPEYAGYTIIQDVGSGINFKRKGLSTILDACIQRTIGEVVVVHRDRLSRFGFDLIELIVQKSGGTITVLDNAGNKSSEDELSEDLLSIIHIFNCRQMGKRSYKSRKITNNQNENLSNANSETKT